MKKLSFGIITGAIIFSLATLPAQAATIMLPRAAAQELLSLLLQELALLEQQLTSETATVTATATTTQQTMSLPTETTFDPQTLVGILCYYDAMTTDLASGETTQLPEEEEIRGSGVIINSRGDILTNRHIVVQPDETTNNSSGSARTRLSYSLDHCEVGQLPAGTQLPTASEIQSLNPYIQVPVLAYNAQPDYVAHDSDTAENDMADFAILRITGLSTKAATFGITSIPDSFPYAKLLAIDPYLTASTTLSGNVLTYGFPGDVTSGQGNLFSTLTMTGSVGNVTEVDGGEYLYKDIPLTIMTDMEISHGRSGSPLIWRGYVVGLITFFIGNDRTNSGSVASDAIIKTLQPLGYLPQ